MANVRIPELPYTNLIDGQEFIEIAQSDGSGGFVSRRTSLSDVNGLGPGNSFLTGPYVVATAYPLTPNARVLQGTATQISITDGGAGTDITAALIATAVTPGTYGGSNLYTQITVDAFGRITAASQGADSGSGTVTSVSVATANGFAGSVLNPTTTPDITISTTITGILVGNGTSMSGTVPASGILTFLATPSSANLASAVTDEVGSGALVFGTSPTFTTSITITQPTSGTTIQSTSTDGGATGPTIENYHDSASPAANDVAGINAVAGNSSTGVKRTLSQVRTRFDTTTNASEAASMAFGVISAGSLADYLYLRRNAAGTATASAVGLPLGQLSFPATQNPSSDANTLDDYEEGTWTPTITFGGGSTGQTYDLRTGAYTKVGTAVILSCAVRFAAKGSSTGTALLTGQPFAVADGVASASSNSGGGSMASLVAGYTLSANTSTDLAFRSPNTTGWGSLTDTNFTNTSAAFFTLAHRTT